MALLVGACAEAPGRADSRPTDLECLTNFEILAYSPDHKIIARVGISESGRLAYQVSRDGQIVISPSPLGWLVDGRDIGLQVAVGKPKTRSINETYPWLGGHSSARNQCSETVIPVTNAISGQAYRVSLRVFNDGVGVRCEIPLAGKHQIGGETVAWRVSPDAEAWWAPFESSYEAIFQGSRFSELPEKKTLEAPVTLRLTNGVFLAISEADCVNYPDMALRREGDALLPTFWASPAGWASDGVLTTPWRVALIASNLNALVNSDIFPNLCPPPGKQLARAKWIRPGRVLWQWYSSGAPRFEDQTAWYDAAARLGWEYYLIDDGWRDWRAEGKDQWECLKQVIDYGKSKGVATVVWVNSKEMRDAGRRRKYLERVKATGAVGIKIDFIPPATPEIMQWYEGALRDTAELELLCNFHGCVKPTGRRRTWPHELTREAVRGHEYHITRYNRTMPLETDTIIPFTRYLLGPADYTPMVFDPAQLRGFTWPHELAQAVVFTSPLMHYGDSYKQYVGSPVEDILKVLPTVWDETRVLPGTEIGKTTAFARRKGREWYIGVLNGEKKTSLELNLDFLKTGVWQATLLSEAADRDDAFDRVERKLTPQDNLTISLRPGSGFVARFTPRKK